jgi:type IV secretory pathway VirB10-like protein
VEKVSVNRSVLIGVVMVAGLSLLTLAFVLGRDSGSGSVPAPLARIERVTPRAQEEPAAPATPVPAFVAESAEARPATVPAVSNPTPGAAPQIAAGEAPAPAGGERSGAAIDPERAAVAAYFDAIDRIQLGAVNGEAEGVANEMAAALANGDTSGLDKMIRQTEAARTNLAAVAPPAPCATHHRDTLASLDDALAVLRSLKSAMESSDPAAQLANVSAGATALRSRADALQKEELALRERYGLKK